MNTLKIKIEDISDKAEGIGRIDGKVCFVPGTLPGEEAEIVITQDKGKFFKGRLAEDRGPSCGGAPLLRMPYKDQLAWKEKHVRDCLVRLAKIPDPKMNPIVGMEDPYHYRNKGEFKIGASLPYCNENCTDCPIQSEKTMEVLKSFRENPRKNAVELIVRTAENGEYMAYTIQKNGYDLLYEGEKILHDHIGPIQIEVDPYSFYQVNSVQREKLYSIVKSYVDEGSSLLDLYCGAGTIGLYCADKCSRVIGVESLHEAILQANRNAIINHIVNTTFVEGKAEDAVAQKLQGVKADAVIVDPPRAGCKESLLQTVAQIGPQKLIYVSCDPATLGRDLRILQERGYQFAEATPVDLFPHTVHVETCVLLVRENVKDEDCVSLSLDLHGLKIPQGEYTPPEKPTYGNVKKWIKEIYGVNVSNLYIAQVKDKLGLEKRANYNLGEGKNKVPVCPEEKEAMIREAFKHFKLI